MEMASYVPSEMGLRFEPSGSDLRLHMLGEERFTVLEASLWGHLFCSITTGRNIIKSIDQVNCLSLVGYIRFSYGK